jgi:hypothetical protein
MDPSDRHQARGSSRPRDRFGGPRGGPPGQRIDFLVDLEPDRSLMDHAALMIELEAFLGRKVDVATERGMCPHIREQVMHDAVQL